MQGGIKMISYYQDIDLNNRQAMIDFLSNHYRYNTMNSWNNSTSYANCVKIHRLDLPKNIMDKAYDMLDMQEVYEELRFVISDWECNYNHSWQVGFNGRSGGYLVLYKGGRKESGYKSHCTKCDQRNYKLASNIDNRCGACGAFISMCKVCEVAEEVIMVPKTVKSLKCAVL